MTAVARGPRIYAAKAGSVVHYVSAEGGLSPATLSLCGRPRDENDPRARWRPLKVLSESARACNTCHASASRQRAEIILPAVR